MGAGSRESQGISHENKGKGREREMSKGVYCYNTGTDIFLFEGSKKVYRDGNCNDEYLTRVLNV